MTHTSLWLYSPVICNFIIHLLSSTAGVRKEDIDGQDVAVFVGSFVKGTFSQSNTSSCHSINLTVIADYEQICLRDSEDQPRYAATGNGIAIMANRLSYYYNISGGSMTIDTGCSASLVCIHQAAETLRRGHASMVNDP